MKMAGIGMIIGDQAAGVPPSLKLRRDKQPRATQKAPGSAISNHQAINNHQSATTKQSQIKNPKSQM
jgi:hypothetical protein